jgi:hypothetical protein
MVCPKIGVGSQTLIRQIIAMRGPICAPLPPFTSPSTQVSVRLSNELKMEVIHGFGGWVSPAGIVAWKLRVALRGKLVDGVGAPHGV